MKFSRLVLIVCSVAVATAMFLGSCKKTATLTSGGILTFSEDTLKFDTVFTAAGSYTNWVVIYNPQAEPVVVSSIRLQNGTSSYFHLNIDGRKGNTASNIKIAAHDSIYVFATVNIDSDRSTTPFLITDALVATMNGRDFSMPITAYGQNAYYIVSDSFGAGTYTWKTDKPYVVIHNCVVGPYADLEIPRGCRVYMHQDAQFIVYYNANLGIGQTPSGSADSVVFQGDRLDRSYFGYVGYPGEWCGFWFVPNSAGNISHTVIKNCGNGAPYYQYSIIPAAIRVDSGARVQIDHSIIENSISLGLLGFQGTINASNCLVHTTGGQALAISQGGYDTLVNCTFANYGTAQTAHSQAGTAVILDWYTPDNKHYYYGNMGVLMRNCIVYGSLDSEIICDTSLTPGNITQTSLIMDHCLVKMGKVQEPFIKFLSCLLPTTADSLFKNTAKEDFHLGTNSPAKGAGTSVSGTDLDNNPWPGGPSDIGCYLAK
jgi:hypothetical protein